MNKYMLTWNGGMDQADQLAEPLGLIRIKHKNSRYTPVAGDIMLNYGVSRTPYDKIMGLKWINHPEAVNRGSNKVNAFSWMKAGEVRTVPWTTDPWEAANWVVDGSVVFGRRDVASFEGRDIDILNKQSFRFDLQLYTKGLLDSIEYRVAVCNGKAFRVHRRYPEDGIEHDPYVRSHKKGWRFSLCRLDWVKKNMLAEAVKAVQALGLNFGAVDLLMYDGLPYVLEVNTAPGHEGETTKLYIKELNEAITNLVRT